jgi:dihydroorotate dehydrogenase electron transfer subunit
MPGERRRAKRRRLAPSRKNPANIARRAAPAKGPDESSNPRDTNASDERAPCQASRADGKRLMSDPHSTTHAATHYADCAQFHTVEVVENVCLARDTWRVRFHAPEMARRFLPGQFLMLRLAGHDDPLLARPLALYDTVDDNSNTPAFVDVVYLVQGKMTSRLANFQLGRKLDVWGPLGNGFPALDAKHLIFVAGGIGQTPFLALAQECLGSRKYGEPVRSAPKAERITLCYGARRAEYLAGVEDFRSRGVDVRISTDDGSAGRHGLVTDLLREVLAEEAAPSRQIICCGPERMMEATAEVAQAAGIHCLASLETPMACGIGICFSCVARIRDDQGGWDYRRTCVEGPVFDAERIVW